MATSPSGLRQDAGWTLGEMLPRDLPDVLEIERASFPHPWSSTLFLQELRVPFSRILIVRPVGGTAVVGYLCRWFVADEIHILNVAVHPLHRRRRIAALLMDAVLREARERGTQAVTLEVRRSNAAARRMYEALGFDEVGVRRDYYGAGEDALIMRLTLADD